MYTVAQLFLLYVLENSTAFGRILIDRSTFLKRCIISKFGPNTECAHSAHDVMETTNSEQNNDMVVLITSKIKTEL